MAYLSTGKYSGFLIGGPSSPDESGQAMGSLLGYNMSALGCNNLLTYKRPFPYTCIVYKEEFFSIVR
jgi:hypothetical protein